jgi:Ca2+-binding RTX toxin-like protein
VRRKEATKALPKSHEITYQFGHRSLELWKTPMANEYYDASHLPTYAADGSVTLNDGSTVFGLNLNNNTVGGDAIRATGVQDITIVPGFTIRGQGDGIEFTAPGGNKIYSQGFISSGTGAGILFSGGGYNVVTNQGSIVGGTGIKIVDTASNRGRLDVLNSGTIITSGKAILGGFGDDVVTNSGVIRATGTDAAIDLGEGNDVYNGATGTVIGTIDLGKGNDKAYGGSGSEVFRGGAGDDYIDGGAGSDTVDYSDVTSGISVKLNTTDQQYIGGGHDSDILINIENAIGGSKNDTLTGSNGDNSLTGGDGDDVLEGGAGNDVLDGGEGIDTVRYTGAAVVIPAATAMTP